MEWLPYQFWQIISQNKNEQNLMLPSVGVASTKDGSDVSLSVIDSSTHRNSTANFFATETLHQNAKDVLNAHRVAVSNTYCCVRQRHAPMMVQWGAMWGRNGRCKKQAARRAKQKLFCSKRFFLVQVSGSNTLICFSILKYNYRVLWHNHCGLNWHSILFELS